MSTMVDKDPRRWTFIVHDGGHMSHDEGLLVIMLSKMTIHKTNYYNAAEKLITYYYVRGRRVGSSQGPRKKIKRVRLNFFFKFQSIYLQKTS